MTLVPSSRRERFVAAFATGVEQFNTGLFWEAHESWETVWLEAEEPMKQFLQGLIQIAAAYHHVARGNLRGAGRLFAVGLGRLEASPAGTCGLDREAFLERCRDHEARVSSALSSGARGFELGGAAIIDLASEWQETIQEEC